MTVPYQKRPLRVQVPDRRLADLANAGLVDAARAGVFDEPQPSGQVLNMVYRAARTTLDRDIDDEAAYELVAEVLVGTLRYQPPADGLDRWKTLLGYLADFERWGDAGPNFDETGLTEADWNLKIHNEIVGLAGRPL